MDSPVPFKRRRLQHESKQICDKCRFVCNTYRNKRSIRALKRAIDENTVAVILRLSKNIDNKKGKISVQQLVSRYNQFPKVDQRIEELEMLAWLKRCTHEKIEIKMMCPISAQKTIPVRWSAIQTKRVKVPISKRPRNCKLYICTRKKVGRRASPSFPALSNFSFSLLLPDFL